MANLQFVGNRPLGLKDAQGNLMQRSYDDLAFQGEYSGTDLIYKGFARPGVSTGDSVWQIAKCTYDASHNLLTVTWPEDPNGNASNDFQFIWTSRGTYTYV